MQVARRTGEEPCELGLLCCETLHGEAAIAADADNGAECRSRRGVNGGGDSCEVVHGFALITIVSVMMISSRPANEITMSFIPQVE